MPFIYTDNDRRVICEQALALRYNERLNWEEVADRLQVARSTLTEWRRTEEWKESDYRWRQMLRNETRGDLEKMSDEAVMTLYELMKTDRSGYVKFMCASKILEMNQVGEENAEITANQQKELNDFLLKQVKRNQVETLSVQPGGLLPIALQEANEMYRVRKLEEIEATFRSLPETPEDEGLVLDDEVSLEPSSQSDEPVLW